MSNVLKRKLGLVAVVVVAGILGWAIILGRKQAAAEAKSEQPCPASAENGVSCR